MKWPGALGDQLGAAQAQRRAPLGQEHRVAQPQGVGQDGDPGALRRRQRRREPARPSLSTFDSQARSLCTRTDGLPSERTQYACHGGGFPLRVKSVESLVGVAVVSCVSSGYLCSSPSSLPAARPSLTLRFPPTPFSGLKQEEDHQVIVDVLRELIAEQEK